MESIEKDSPLLFLNHFRTLGPARRIGSCSSRLGRRNWDLEEEDRGLASFSSIRVHSFCFLMFYLNFGMYQTSIMYSIRSRGFWLHFEHESYIYLLISLFLLFLCDLFIY